jgi:hypothetical protein
MKKLILVTLIFILAACSTGGSEFSRNQKKWEDANIPHYRFELSIGCFCPFQSQMPLTVEVVENQIVSMIGADGSVILDTDPNYHYYSEYATIDGLFTKLEADLNGDADEVTVTYDATYGFPAEVKIDKIKEATDDELYLNASNFEPLP